MRLKFWTKLASVPIHATAIKTVKLRTEKEREIQKWYDQWRRGPQNSEETLRFLDDWSEDMVSKQKRSNLNFDFYKITDTFICSALKNLIEVHPVKNLGNI